MSIGPIFVPLVRQGVGMFGDLLDGATTPAFGYDSNTGEDHDRRDDRAHTELLTEQERCEPERD